MTWNQNKYIEDVFKTFTDRSRDREKIDIFEKDFGIEGEEQEAEESEIGIIELENIEEVNSKYNHLRKK